MLFTHFGSDGKDKSACLAALGLKEEYQGLPWPLPNMKPATETGFWGWRSSYSFRGEIWCGQKKIDGRWATIILFWMNHSQFIAGGFAVAVFREYGKEETRYFEWRACDHKFNEKNAGHCLHRYTCERCGASYDVDSSG